MNRSQDLLALSGILIAALSLKVLLLLAGVVVFDSDEAVVGLMARHILDGARPIFFYGQAYMGSLDAWLVAGAFVLFGPSVWVIRAVQVVLFLVHVALTYVLARRWSEDRATALLGALLMALPPATLTLYTTVSLGGYGETLVLGDLVLLVGWKLATDRTPKLGHWALLGALAGLGFWTLGLIVVYLVPLAALLVWRHRAFAWRGYLVAGAAFLLGSSPWWAHGLGHGWQAVRELHDPATAVDPLAPILPIGTRVLGLFLIGLPGLVGARLPWSAEPLSVAAIPLLAMGYAAVAVHAWGQARRKAWRGGYRLLWGFVLVFVAMFVLTRFGSDPTGRYFVPLYTPLTIVTAAAIVTLSRRVRWGALVLILLLAFNMWGTWKGAASAAGFTAQYNPQVQYGNRHDADLIAFLEAHGGARGYTNYWIAYKIAFLSRERIVLVPSLPDKPGRQVSASGGRYPPYADLVSIADRVVYVTGNQPELEARLRDGFAAHEISYRERGIGPYRVFYDLSSPVSASDLLPQKQ